MSAPTCSQLTAGLGVDPAGTASAIRSWVLLEHRDPWSDTSRDEVFARVMPTDRHDLLLRLWEHQQLRPLLMRRSGREGRRATTAPVMIVGAALQGRHWAEQLPATELPRLDLEALAAGVPGHGEPVDGPLFAVCTNGSVDRCCAVRGRPLAAALSAAHPGRTWEVTHVGGCRFAANLLVLPDGVVHGSLTAQTGLRIAEAALLGHVDAAQLRGRTGSSPWAATAEVTLRRRLGLTDLNAVQVLHERPHPDTVPGEDGDEPAGADVVVRVGADLWRVVVRVHRLGIASSVCTGAEPLRTTVVTDTVLLSR